jgi:hypothetical protein
VAEVSPFWFSRSIFANNIFYDLWRWYHPRLAFRRRAGRGSDSSLQLPSNDSGLLAADSESWIRGGATWYTLRAVGSFDAQCALRLVPRFGCDKHVARQSEIMLTGKWLVSFSGKTNTLFSTHPHASPHEG